MKEGKFIIGSSLGIHARPAANIAKMSAKYKCEVTIEVNNKKASAKNVLMLISLGAKKGSNLTLNVEGEGEEALFEELREYIENNFYEK
jgi:phosphocarrier protein